MDYSEFLKLVIKRRSVRSFKPDPIPDDFIDKIIDAARWAPSGANSQPWEFVVVKDRDLKDKIVEILSADEETSTKMELTREPEMRHPGPIGRKAGQRPGYAVAPVFIVVCGDYRTKEAMTVNAMHNHGPDGNYHFIGGMASALLYMHLAAASLGLGSRWVSSINNPLPQVQVKQLLGIPKQVMVYEMLPVGYPGPASGEERRSRARRNAAEMTHNNMFDMSKYRSPGQMREFIKQVHGNR